MKIKVFDFFSGCGGTSLGFMRAGMIFRIGSDTNVKSVSILIGVDRMLSFTPASTVRCFRTSASLSALRYAVAGSFAGPEYRLSRTVSGGGRSVVGAIPSLKISSSTPAA